MIELPWTPSELSPNARKHFRVRAPIVKTYKAIAHNVTRVACADHGLRDRFDPEEGEITLAIEFYPPDRRRRDLDNMLASFKAGLDGMAEGLAVDDQRFALSLRRREPVKGGKITVVLA